MREPSLGFKLTFFQRLTYSVGHVFNDLCSSMWFSYLLIFMRDVVKLDNSSAGYLLLWGQVVDALFTPVIGYASDKMQGILGYGKRKSWHAIGTVCVAVSFPFLFLRPINFDEAFHEAAIILYYGFFIAVFQFGWAATQVAHLALIPELTPIDSERVELNAFRNAFTVLSSMTVYGSAWLIFSVDENEQLPSKALSIHVMEFRVLMLVSLCVGIFFSLLYHLGTTESHVDHSNPQTHAALINIPTISCQDWLKEYQFYLIALMYLCSRLIVNVSQTYWPLYLTDSLKLTKNFIAIVPLVVFSSGFVTSLLMRPLNSFAGRKAVCLLGLVVTIASCSAMWFLSETNAIYVLFPAVLLGAGGSILLVTSLSMTADLIGKHTESSAFVFGAMSFTDKLSSGACIAIIQVLHPCTSSKCCADCVWYYRNIMVILPSVVAVISIGILVILAPMKLGRLRRFHL